MSIQKDIQQLLQKYEEGTCTPEESLQLQQWLDGLATRGKEYVFTADERRSSRRRMLKNVQAGKRAGVIINIRQWAIKTAAAAAVVVMLTAGGWWYQRAQFITISSNAALAVTRVVLPDSSVVWLNRNTAITYHKGFALNRRVQLLQGEVFFDVKKDAQHPFVIQSGDIYTTVKGTSFSVAKNHYTNDVKVTVVTGRVAISKGSDTLAVLTPGKRLRYVEEKEKAGVDEASPAEANAWVKGDALLQHAGIMEVASWLHQQYNIPVENLHRGNDIDFYLSFSKGITLQDAIKIINLVGAKHQVTFFVEQNKVVIK
ncbi:FecR family protein [Filimonas lacunae]|uniref:FecR family protein n=1 Tax=Filimonas lacunae TaxID=477680 RepID=A0A173MJH1_9BACT|nr:FecR domain-containing protein [Filimonas lacunae]BAV07783.1 anti-sigma factor [Filimonas lacunae]SIT04709.1 FecR family protein [Filimonas lacunae]